MARVKNPTKQGAIVASRSIGSSSVGEWIVFVCSNAMEIHILWEHIRTCTDTGKDTEDSLVVVSDTGCELAG